MKAPLNIGNFLSFFDRLSWQHRFQAYSGQRTLNLKNWGIIWPKNGVPAFQLMLPIDKPTSVEWKLYDIDGNLAETLDEDSLYIGCYDDYTSFTYQGAPICSLSVECGFYFMTLNLDGTTYYSEVFQLLEIPDNGYINLSVARCQLNEPESGAYIEWEVEAEDCVSHSVYTDYIEVVGTATDEQGDTLTYQDFGMTGELIFNRYLAVGDYTISQKFKLTYDPLDPCNTYQLTKI